MIPGRTKGSLTRFFRDQGAWWCRQVEIVVFRRIPLISGSHRPVLARRPPCPRPFSRRPLVHRRLDPGTPGTATPRPQISGPRPTNRTCSEPASPCCGGRIISPTPTRSISIGCSTLIHVSEPRGTRSRSSTSCMRPTTWTQANEASGTVRRPLRHRADTRIPRSGGHDHRLGRRDPGLPHQPTGIQRTPRRDQQPPPWSYAASPTGSPTTDNFAARAILVT